MESNLKTSAILGLNQSEIDDTEFKKFIIDVARPTQRIEELDFMDYKSEMCIQNTTVVSHIQDNQNNRYKAAFTIPADRFNLDKGYTIGTLKQAIKNIYQSLYSYKHIALIEQYLKKNIEQANKNYRGSIFEGIENGDAMALAITFYLGVKQEEEGEVQRDAVMMSRFSFQDAQPEVNDQKNELIEAMIACKEESQQLCWWINRAISYIKPYVGECTRMVEINSRSMTQYYQPGKIFNWIQFQSANKGEIISDWTKSRNVVFHIFSQTGRDVSQFQAEKNLNDESTIIFSPGCEFLVCKNRFINGKTHIWIREIHTGFGSNIVLWIDDHLFPENEEDLENQDYLHEIYHRSFDKNINFILKASSSVGWAYINSPLFKTSLQVCKSFKIVSDMARFNESEDRQECYVAGAKFIYQFRQKTQNSQNIDKIRFMIFTMNKERANEALSQFGIEEGAQFSPLITVNAEEFLQFLDS